jgi:hypothetical protein
MSKVQHAKDSQGFQEKPVHPRCGDCQHFSSEVERWTPSWSKTEYVREHTLRCTLGGFKVGKSSVCSKFARKEA